MLFIMHLTGLFALLLRLTNRISQAADGFPSESSKSSCA
jgi:hypothetical protein